MKSYPTNQIRNLACIGHGHAGKTQLVSSLLHLAGATTRWGKVDEGTTVTDHDEDSIARKITLNNQLAHCEWREHKVNLIDTPGFSAFVPHARPALRVADCALVVVDGVTGVEVGTEKTWAFANEFITPRMLVVTKLDKERADFGSALDSARNTFSRAIVPFTLPIGQEMNFRGVVDVVHMKAYEYDSAGKAKEVPIPETGREVVERERERLVEVIAESDDSLMEKWLENGTLEEADIIPNISRAIAASRLCPVFAVSSLSLVGLQQLLDGIIDYAPAPDTHAQEHGKASLDEGAAEVTRGYHPEEPFSAYVFRTVADPFAGRINVMKIISGHVKPDANVQNTTRGATERLGALHSMQGKQLDKIDEASAGDIIAVVKLKETQTGDTLSDRAAAVVYDPIEYPEAAISFAIEPKSRQDEEKISVALHKILEDDPSLHFDRDAQTKEFLLSGSGQLHIETVVEKLKNRYHVEVALHPPKVPYKETITARAEVQGRHKKQTGGRGQFGDCKVVFEPLPRGGGFVFEDKIFGGSVPHQFRPAIEKGIVEAASHGAIAGYPLVDFKVTLIDGSYHTVDSDEHSFRAAGRKAFRNAVEKVKPTILEPIMDVEVVAPAEASGDIMGDLNSRRGRVQGMDMRGKNQVVKAQVPMSEMLDYQSKLNSITAARGSFHMEFSHYDPVPGQIANKIVEQAKAEGRIRAEEEE
ncbi:MAG: elongation factor [Acidobacteriota bacterium]|nr:elongation factor [Acidobacteriota bacterium]